MILEWYWLAAIGIITLFLGIYAVWKSEFQSPQAGLKGRMQDFAKRAINMAAKEHGVKLDYSTESISKVDSILETYFVRHQSQAIPEKELSQIVLTWGGYVGTTLIKQVGGTWQTNSLTAGNNTYPIIFSTPPSPDRSTKDKRESPSSERHQKTTLNEAIPIIWCLKRIRHGGKESVNSKFLNATKQA